jgi:hypothetical protein
VLTFGEGWGIMYLINERGDFMEHELVRMTIEKFNNWTFTIADVKNILHDRVKFQYIDTDSIIFIDKYNNPISIQHSVILDIQPNFRILDVIILIGVRY